MTCVHAVRAYRGRTLSAPESPLGLTPHPRALTFDACAQERMAATRAEMLVCIRDEEQQRVSELALCVSLSQLLVMALRYSIFWRWLSKRAEGRCVSV